MEEPNTIQMTPPVDESGSIVAFPSEDTSGSFPVHLANERADKLHVALGDKSPGREQLVGALSTSTGETMERMRVASIEDMNKREVAVSALSDMLRTKTSITPDDMAKARDLMNAPPSNPDTVFENVIARAQVEPAKSTSELMDSMGAKQDPDTIAKIKGLFDQTTGVVAKKEYAQRLVDEIQGRVDSLGIVSKGVNMAGNFVPFLSWYRTYDSSKEGFLKGSNIDTQVEDFLYKPLEQGSKELKDKIEALYSKNPVMALEFAQRFVNNNAFESGLDNIFSAVDLAGAPGMAKAALNASKYIARNGIMNAAARNQAVGNFTQATNIRAIDELKARALSQTSVQDFKELENVLPSIVNPQSYVAGGSNVINPVGVARAVKDLEKYSDDLVKSLVLDRNPIDRINPDVKKLMQQDNMDVFRTRYPNANDAIMDVRWVAGADEGVANTDSLAIRLGDKKAQPFLNENVAKNVVEDFYGLKDFEIKPSETGAGFYVETRRHVDENLISTYSNMSKPKGASKFNYLGWVASADNFFDKTLNAARKQVGYGISDITLTVRRALKDIPSISDENFNTFLVAGREQEVTYYTANEMEKAWKTKFGYLPTEQHIVDYNKVVMIHELDLASRDLSLLSKKASQGFENHILPFNGFTKELPQGLVVDNKLGRIKVGTKNAGNDNPKSTKLGQFDGAIGTPANDATLGNQNLTKLSAGNDNQLVKQNLELEGKYLKDGIPWDMSNRFTMAIWDEDLNKIKFVRKNVFTNPTKTAELNDLVETKGFKVIQLSPHSRDAIRQLGLDMPDFILAKDFKSERLSFNQIPKKEGSSHVIYPKDGSFISQADVHVSNVGGTRESSFLGNNNLLAFEKPELASKYHPMIEKARQLLAEGNPGFDSYVRNNLPFSPKEFQDNFKVFNGNGRFDINQPFMIRKHGENTLDSVKGLRGTDGELLYPSLENYAESALNPLNSDTFLRFAQERDGLLKTITDKGTAHNPSLQLDPAVVLNPKDAMVDATESLMQSRYLDDLKVRSARDFVTKYQELLNAPLEDMLRDPSKYLVNPPWRENITSNPLLAEARNFRRASMEFMNLDTPFMKDMKNMVTRIYDSIFPEEGVIRSKLDIFDETTGGALKDPATFLRRWAFRVSQINPDALLTQATQVINATSIAGPVAGSRGVASMNIMKAFSASGESEQVLNVLANRFAKIMKTNPDHIKEMMQAYKRSGFGSVAEEHAFAEGFGRPSVIQTTTQKAMDVGLTFFREGERVTREVAYGSAYWQWRAMNPETKLTKAIENQILSKADIMSGNMSKASNATWSNGAISVPSQFLKYQTQLMEQILIGRELSGAERLRLLGGQTVMWGIPVGAVGSVAGIYPWADSITDYFRRKGIDTDSNRVSKVFNDGVASVAFELATGEKYDIAGRFGPKGLSVIKDYQSGRKDLIEILGGPSGKLIFDTYKTGSKALVNTMDMVFSTTDPKDPTYKPLIDDVITVTNNAALGRKGWELWNALNFQRWVTKSRPEGIDGVTNSEAYLRAAMGITPDRIAEHFSKQDSVMSHELMQKQYEKDIMTNFKQIYANLENPEAQETYRQRIHTLYVKGGFSESERYAILQRSLKNERDTIESVNRKYLQKFPLAKDIVDKTRDNREQTIRGIN